MESKTIQVLEFPKVLGALADFAVSEAGQTACRAIQPFETIHAVRQAAKLAQQASLWLAQSDFSLVPFPPLDGLLDAVLRPAAILDQDDLFALRQVLTAADATRTSVAAADAQSDSQQIAELRQLLSEDDWPDRTIAAIRRCLDQDGGVKDASSPDLLAVRREIRSIHQRCTKRVKDFILQENMAAAMQDEFMTVSSDRYVLPLKVNFKNKIQGIIHDYSQTGETCYFEPMFLVETNNRLQELKREERKEERKVLAYLSDLVRDELDGVRAVYSGLVELDVLCAKHAFGETLDGRCIDVVVDGPPVLKKARHPLLALTGDDIQPLDIRFEPEHKGLIISGGNAGGKTVCLKTLGLIGLMAFSAVPVPAASGSVLPYWSNIFVVMGDEQSLEENVSTFTAQIRYLKRTWDRVGSDTLYILDEFGAGTDPTQGAALAQAVIDSLVELSATAVVATHFPALKAYAMASPSVRAASVLFDPGTKRPLYRLAYDQVGASIALDVAREHGLPPQILEKAEKYLLLDGSDTTSILDRLNEMAVQREQELERTVAEREKMESKRAKLEARFEKERAKLLSDVQSQAQNVVKQWQADRIGRKTARKKLADVREKIEGLGPKPETVAAFRLSDIEPGQKVSYLAWDKVGTVQEINLKKRQAKVDIGGVAMWVKAEHLGPAHKAQTAVPRREQSVAAKSDLSLEVDVRGNRADMALSMLERALDDALRKGADRIEVVHGRGTGALRREVHEFLKRYPAVQDFSLADEERGGDGMTQVTLK